MKMQRLYVVNVSHTVTVDELEEVFSECGELINVEMIPEKCAAIVEYSTIEEAERAREKLNGKKVGGKKITVKEETAPSNKKKEKPRLKH